jgi:predicted alpha/beta-hydrolase family hydrolase
MADAKELRFAVEGTGEVSALLQQPAKAHSLLALAHGAGAGMRHAFMEQLANELSRAGVATLRYQFPYMEQRRKVPDKPAVLTTTVQSAVRIAAQSAPDLPLFAGGKSMGGRMTSQAAAAGLLTEVRGIVFYGFPLHPPKQPGTKRADHLIELKTPMLFLQGTRDPLAPVQSIRSVCKKLEPRAAIVIFEGADHSFHVPKSAGKTDSEMIRELAQSTAAWMTK